MLAKLQLQRPIGLGRTLTRRSAIVQAVARPTGAARSLSGAAAAKSAAAAAPSPSVAPLSLAALAAAAPFLLDTPMALATGGDFGLLEGRTAALVHPAVMLILFGLSSYAAYLGWQWRRVRTVGDDIKALKAQLPKPAAAAEGAAAAPPSPLEGQIAALEKVRWLRGWLCAWGCGSGEEVGCKCKSF